MLLNVNVTLPHADWQSEPQPRPWDHDGTPDLQENQRSDFQDGGNLTPDIFAGGRQRWASYAGMCAASAAVALA
ncbi:MAG: hypothetical protein WA175_06120, partial [Candidatus Acidiferrales bacterium]